MAQTRTRRGSGTPPLNDKGLAVFRYDKNPDGTNARFVHARPDTPWYQQLIEAPGWYPVDPDERADYEAAKTAAEDKDRAFNDEQERMSRRAGTLSSLEGASRGRGRPSNAEKAALARADAAEQALAEKDAEIEALRQQLAERDATAGKGDQDDDI